MGNHLPGFSWPQEEEAEMWHVEATRQSNWKEKSENLNLGGEAGSWVSVFAGRRKRNGSDDAG